MELVYAPDILQIFISCARCVYKKLNCVCVICAGHEGQSALLVEKKAVMNDDGVIGKEASKTVHMRLGLQTYDMNVIRHKNARR